MGQPLPRKEVRGHADLAGKYRLIAELGQGGMATVYLAVVLGNSGFRKLAVVKLLRPEFAVDDEFIQMFLDEARLCARLSHPNIVHTYDVGVDESGHLIAMEYLDGVSLHAASAKLGRHGGPFGFALQARVLLEVIEGLRYAHELKDYDGSSLEIVHRDVTPHNIFVTYDGQVKLLDFGIAKAATSSVKTATGVIKGKLTYMAPEQARGDPVDARADLYAVGVMLWEAVTGRRRWPTGLTEPALFTRLATGELPEIPNAAAKGFPAEIDDVVMKALAPKPDDRYQTAAEFRDALDAALGRMPAVSLRDLGGMLAKSFDEDRARIRQVIEEQFRAIETGGPISDPHQLPAVPHPSFMTASESIERSGASRSREDVHVDVLVESQSRRVKAPGPTVVIEHERGRISPLNVVFGACAIGLTLVVSGLALANRPAAPLAPVPAAASTAHVELHPDRSNVPREGVPVQAQPTQDASPRDEVSGAQASQNEGSPAGWVRRGDGSVRHGGPPVPARPDGPHTPAGSSSNTSPVAAASGSASGEASPETPPVRTAPVRPKVQLERENPWP